MKAYRDQASFYRAIYMMVVIGSIPLLLMAQQDTENRSMGNSGLSVSPDMESILLHTDKPFYLTGETLWFKAYCTNKQQKSLSKTSSVLYVEIFDSSNQPIAQLATAVESGLAYGQVFLGSNLSTGTYLLRAYTSWMRNGSVDDYYQQRIWIVNPLTALDASQVAPQATAVPSVLSNLSAPGKIEIVTDKEVYTNRQPVHLEITSKADAMLQGNLSVSVYRFHPGLETGLIEQQADDNLKQFENTLVGKNYFPETVGPIVYGQFQDNSAGDDLMVSIAGSSARVYQAVPIDSRNFAVQLTPETDYQRLYFWTVENGKPSVFLKPVFDPRLPENTLEGIRIDSAAIRFIEDQSVNMQVSNLYSEYNSIHGGKPMKENIQTPFYGAPEFIYYLDDYTRFPGLEEVFREYIRYVSLRRKSGLINMYVWDHYSNNQSLANNVYFNQPALILLDGVPVQNMEWLLALDPLKIKSVEVVTKKYIVGNKSFHGVVNLHSYDQEFIREDLPLEIQIIDFPDLQLPLTFQHPMYEVDTIKSRIPDRRNTLFWNPKVQVSSGHPAQILFYTADAVGTYQVLVRGIDANGRPVYRTKLFKVVGGTAQ